MVNNKAEQVYRLPIVSRLNSEAGSTVFGQLLHSIFLLLLWGLSIRHDPRQDEITAIVIAIDFHLTLQNSSGHFKFTV